MTPAGTRPGNVGIRRRASWVMGRSARWHDPDVQNELSLHDLTRERQAVPVLAADAAGTPTGALVAIRRILRLRRRPRW